MIALSRIEPVRRRGLATLLTERRDDIAGAVLGAAMMVAVLAYVTAMGRPISQHNDFYREAWPAYQALAAGHIVGFLRLGPAYIGSLVLRAPLAVIPTLWGGGAREVYFASALPCVVVVPIFAAWLGAQPRADARARNRIGPMLLCVLNPLVFLGLFYGHPEEVLGAVLCVLAVVAAVNGNPAWAGLLLGLAVINKSWALVAIPVALAVTPGHRGRLLAITVAVAGSVMIPVTLVRATGPGGFGSSATLGTGIGTIFTSPQLLWWFGRRSWIVAHAHEGIVLVSVICSVVWWWARRGAPIRGLGSRSIARSAGEPARARARRSQALLLLALVLLLRAALDPWNNAYYEIPFIFALLAYEVLSDRPPALTVICTVLLFVIVPVDGWVLRTSGNPHAAVYAAVVLPLIGYMAARLYIGTPLSARRLKQGRTAGRPGRSPAL